MKPTDLADALDHFWNPACTAIQDSSFHGPASGSDVVGAIAQGLAAVANHLRQLPIEVPGVLLTSQDWLEIDDDSIGRACEVYEGWAESDSLSTADLMKAVLEDFLKGGDPVPDHSIPDAVRLLPEELRSRAEARSAGYGGGLRRAADLLDVALLAERGEAYIPQTFRKKGSNPPPPGGPKPAPPANPPGKPT